MRVLGLIFLVVIALSGSPVHAQSSKSLPVQNEIQVRAVVLDSQSIIVDDDHNIQYIAGNTYKDVTPSVFVGAVTLATQIELTEEILQQYRFFVPVGTNKPGIFFVYLPELLKNNSIEKPNRVNWLDTAISTL